MSIESLNKAFGVVSSKKWYHLGLEEHGARATALKRSTYSLGRGANQGQEGAWNKFWNWRNDSRFYGDEGAMYDPFEYDMVLTRERRKARKARTWK